jgi:hypothetical protein
MRQRTTGRLGVAVAMVMATSFGAPAAAQAPPLPARATEPEHLLVTGTTGADLGPDPRVSAGAILTVTVRGFAARAHVEVRLAGQAALPYRPPADADGVLRFLYRVPADLAPGAYRLLFSGAPGEPAGVAPESESGNLIVSVPNIAIVRFAVGTR